MGLAEVVGLSNCRAQAIGGIALRLSSSQFLLQAQTLGALARAGDIAMMRAMFAWFTRTFVANPEVMLRWL